MAGAQPQNIVEQLPEHFFDSDSGDDDFEGFDTAESAGDPEDIDAEFEEDDDVPLVQINNPASNAYHHPCRGLGYQLLLVTLGLNCYMNCLMHGQTEFKCEQ